MINEPEHRSAVLILSGGLDSAVLAYYLRAGGTRIHALSIDYGQRHVCELDFARKLADRTGATWDLVDLAAAGVVNLLRPSSLTSGDVTVESAATTRAGTRSHIVPNRNVIMLALAYGAAVKYGAGLVCIGVNATDVATPDCRPEFLASYAEMENRALAGLGDVRIEAPFANMQKWQIVALGHQLGVPFADTWSCFAGGSVHCGRCLACVERHEAFRDADITDPTEYSDPAVTVRSQIATG